MSEKTVNRVVPLDWLRGLCAISIMLYHFFFMGKNDPTTIFSKLGVYGVSTFFIISGLSMAIVYNHYIKGLKESTVFFLKRLFRIIPIYAIACILTMLLSNNHYSFTQIILNITTLFGFFNLSSGYIPTGGWSIGNEMVFYLLTPFILFLYDKKKLWGNLLLLGTIIVGLYFAFFLMNPNDSLSSQWRIYINPLNNLFLFVLGIAIFYNFGKVKVNQLLNIALLFVSFVLFFLYPFYNQQDTATGGGRIIFTLIVSVWVFSFFKMKIAKMSKIGMVFETFGMATYGVYILHPIVLNVLNLFFTKILLLDSQISTGIAVILAIICTIIIAILSYYYFELKISSWGKKLIKKYIQ